MNKTVVGNWNFCYEDPINNAQKIFIPAKVVSQNNFLEITFRCKDPQSPAKLNLNSDRRLLGIGVKNLCIQGISS